MTSGNMPTRVAMPCPFADEGDVASIGDTTGNTINFPDGFPEVYSTPPSANGRLVQRDEVNALGKVATQNQFYHQCGGINTFDATFATKIGGYPKGAILRFLQGDNIFDVISMVDNNAVNFVENGVDGVNWRFLNYDYGTSSSGVLIGKFTVSPLQTVVTTYSYQGTTYGSTTSWFYDCGTVTVPKDGTLYLDDISMYQSIAETYASDIVFQGIFGAGIVACKVTGGSYSIPNAQNKGNWKGIYMLSDMYSYVALGGTKAWEINSSEIVECDEGDTYAIGIVYGMLDGDHSSLISGSTTADGQDIKFSLRLRY